MTIETRVAQLAREMMNDNASLRHGQALMNALHSVSPQAYVFITSSEVADPFYNDKLVPNFWVYLAEFNSTNNFE